MLIQSIGYVVIAASLFANYFLLALTGTDGDITFDDAIGAGLVGAVFFSLPLLIGLNLIIFRWRPGPRGFPFWAGALFASALVALAFCLLCYPLLETWPGPLALVFAMPAALWIVGGWRNARL